jgi:glycosyltransferase involved in cell wall biosynthesis
MVPAFEAGGVSVAQVHLGAALDPDLLRSGMGDSGGIATLLVKLGAALDKTPGITQVVTIGRGTARDLRADEVRGDGGHQFASVALEPEEGTSFADRWPARIAAERGIRRALRRHGRPDVLHLRMADVGTLAAANVALSLGIPTVFSLAPDPHALIASREAAGEMDRRTFGADDATLNLWYRVSLVERLARQADHVVLFPREHLADQLREFVGIDVKAQPARFTVVPEGIDAAEVRSVVAARAGTSSMESGTTPMSGALSALLDKVAALPAHRHNLPVVLSVGRLNELKGMARLAEAMALDPALRARATLVIVGGDLAQPSAAEAAELGRIQAAQAAQPELADALILLGHRPHHEVADLLGAVRFGVPGLIGPNGAYACASRKEEFGLAIVEALAAGLPVVAPLAGGPQTYVENGRTGWLVDTTDPRALAGAMSAALDISDRPGRAAHASDMVARDYDISAMARALTTIYDGVAARSVEQLAS